MKGFGIGKIFNIKINIDWSWLLIFILVSWNLAASLGQLHPEWTIPMSWGLAIAAALLFFISVLAHELAHSVVARAMGVPVRSITLFLFGGVSDIQKEPSSPFSEFMITIVGPLTSFILGWIFLAMGVGSIMLSNIPATNPATLLSQVDAFETVFIWLGAINILVAIFNLIPGFPLDGGRIVRSILWAVTSDLQKATRWASSLGQTMAWLLILAGISMVFGVQIPILGTGFINGIWLIFIGWFLQNAAIQSYRKVVIQDILNDIPVKRMMSTHIPIVTGNTSVSVLIDEYIMKSEDQAFIVIEDDKIAGLVTINDVRRVLPNERTNTTVQDIMTPSKKMIVVAPEEDVSEAFERLQVGDIRQLPVVQENKIVGFLRRKDIVRWLQLQSQLG